MNGVIRGRARAGRLLGPDRRPEMLDGAVAVAYLVFLLGSGPGEMWWWLLTPAIAAPLAVRRRWPRTVLIIVVLASVAGLAGGVLTDPLLAVTYATYPVALALPDLRPDPTVPLAVLVGGAFCFGLAGGAGGTAVDAAPGGPGRQLVTAVVTVGTSWTLGRLVRARRREAARASHEQAERRVMEERLRIARDLHDLVSSSLSVIGVRAAVAGYLVDEHGVADAMRVREALRVIEQASQEGLLEMRQMLDVMRGEAEHRPDLEQRLRRLVERAEQAGLQVTLELTDISELAPEQSLVVERIVQESLANVTRHAGPTLARVGVQGSSGIGRVVVEDDGAPSPPVANRRPGPAGPGAGHGLVGMRERVESIGGQLQVGPQPAKGWRVQVTLPAPAGRRPGPTGGDSAGHGR